MRANFVSVTFYCGHLLRAVELESEGIVGGVGVGKDVPIPIPTSI
jgi:hypothetical protein